MASLVHLTRAETVLSQFSSDDQARISSSAVASFSKQESDYGTLFNYSLDSVAKQRLSKRGLFLSPYSFVSHSHPVCKTIENCIIHVKIPNHIDESFTIIGIKDKKLSVFKKVTGLKLIESFNRFLTSGDISRYTPSKFFHSAKERIDLSIPDLHKCPSLRGLIPSQLLQKKVKRFFLYDELHYWSKRELINFLDIFEPEMVVATHVFPKEILKGAKESLNPWAYQFKILDSKVFSFAPDGEWTEAYEQPIDGGEILRCNRIQTSKRIYSVQVVDTIFCHSIVIITKDNLSNPSYRTFAGFDAISTGKLQGLGGDLHELIPVRCETVLSIFKYLRTLKKPDMESAMAKLRQMVDEPSGYEIRFIEELAAFMLNNKECFDIIGDSFLHKVKVSLCQALPDSISKIFKVLREKKLSEFIRDLEPYQFTIKLKTLKIGGIEEGLFNLSSMFEEIQFLDLIPLEINFEKKRQLRESFNYDSKYSLSRAEHGLEMVTTSSYSKEYLYKLFFYDLCNYYSELATNHTSAVRMLYKDLCTYKLKEFILRLDAKKINIRSYRLFSEQKLINFKIFVYAKLVEIKRHLLHDKKARITWPYKVESDLLRSRYSSLIMERKSLGEEFASIFLKKKKGGAWFSDFDQTEDGPYFNSEGRVSKTTLSRMFHHVSVEIKEKEIVVPEEKSSIEPILFGTMYEEIFPKSVAENVDEVSETSNPSIHSDDRGLYTFEDAEGISSIMHEVLTHSIDSAHVKELTKFDTAGDGDCFWHAISTFIGLPAMTVKDLTRTRAISENIVTDKTRERFLAQFEPGAYAEDEAITACIRLNSLKIVIKRIESENVVNWLCLESLSVPRDAPVDGYLIFTSNPPHYSTALPREGCVIRAVAEALRANPEKILNLLVSDSSPSLIHDLTMGYGIQEAQLDHIFTFFDIEAHIFDGTEEKILNENGNRSFCFSLLDGHIEYAPNIKPTISLGAYKPKAKAGFGYNEKYQLLAKQNSDLIIYAPSIHRARKLEDSLLNGTTGVYCSKIVQGQTAWLSSNDSLNFEKREINCVLGTFGSGKSTTVINFLKDNLNSRNVVITPRRKLADQMLDRLGIKAGMKKRNQVNTSVMTFETAIRNMKRISSGNIFIDEVQLFPPGYLDLICLCSPMSAKIMVMGDPAQSSYDNEDDREIFINSPSDINILLDGQTYNYLIKSRRFINECFKDYLPCEFDEDCFKEEFKFEFIKFDSYEDMKKTIPVKDVDAHLVSSFSEKSLVKAHLGRTANALTFGESTGLTFNYVSVLLTADSMMADNKRWLVALSRAKIGVLFVNYSGLTYDEFARQMNPSFLSSFMYMKPDQELLRQELPGKPNFVSSLSRIGTDEINREERLAGDPWLKTMIFLGQREEKVKGLDLPKCEPQASNMKIHCPISSPEVIRARYNELIAAKELREHRISNLITEQFTEEKTKNCKKELTNQAERYEAIYPRHKGDDKATFLMGVRKRLKFSNIFQEEQRLRQAIPYGSIMLTEFLKKVRMDCRWDPRVFEEARNDFEVKKLEKSAATLENHSGRSNNDWDFKTALIFMKSQLCTKDGNRFRSAKAGQTLACFQHRVLVRFAPYIRYMEKKLISALPKNYYIHSGKNFDDLQEWVIKNSFDGMCTESDYEAFDSSQDASILSFELALMKYMNIPNDVISDYKFMKMHTWSKLGSLAIMRFTGEAATFLFNTMANMVFTFLTYELNGSESIAFAGDDMCANRSLKKSSVFKEVLDRLTLKAKVLVTSEPTFCGWSLCKYGIIKKPNLVLERMLIAIERDNLANCLDSYAIEVSYAYSLGERLVSLLSKENLDEHYATVRLIIKNEKLLKSDVRTIFLNRGRTSSPERVFHH